MLEFLFFHNCADSLRDSWTGFLYSVCSNFRIGGGLLAFVNKRHTKKAPYLNNVTINRTQLELRVDGLIFKLGKGMRRKPQRVFIVAGTVGCV